MKINTQEVHVGIRVLGMYKDLRVDWRDVKEGKGGRGERGGQDSSPVSPLPTQLSRSRQPSLSQGVTNLALYLPQETS